MINPYIVAITGASGSVYGIRLTEVLLNRGESVILLVSEAGRLVMEGELGIDRHAEHGVTGFFSPILCERMTLYRPDDLEAPPASGSFKTKGMIAIPASMGFIGSVASGVSKNLIERAADVTLKESRPLILVARETPYNVIHLENMLRLARAGAKIVPASPAFYHHPETVQDLVDFVVGKVLDLLGIEHELFKRWQSAGAKDFTAF